MYRGRGGPRQATPAHVQCQKCLKRDMFTARLALHVYWEPADARPYVPRPSRTQQLRNPKLAPKLTNDAPDDLLRKKGVADEELAKREAERKAEELKQRRLRETDADHGVTADSGADQSLRRRRSVSSASDSSVPTYRSTASPPPRWSRSPSPPPRERDLSSGPSGSRSAHYRRHRSPSGDSYDNEPPASRLSEANRQSESPAPRRRRRSSSRGSLSPPPRRERAYRERSPDYGRHDRSSRYGRDRRFSPAPGGSFRPRSPSRSRSRSRSLSKPPVRRDRRDYSPERHPPRRRAEDASRERPQRTPQREPERERSLSPFSKRLAMTRAMNMGRGR